MKDSFSSRPLTYGYPASNPEMASVPIASFFQVCEDFRAALQNSPFEVSINPNVFEQPFLFD
jgi:hypothetical protein